MQHSTGIRFNGRTSGNWGLARAIALTLAGGFVASGCGDDDTVILAGPASAMSGDGLAATGASGSAPEAAVATRSDGAGAGSGECVAARCPAATLLGTPAPGCCQTDGTCGALVELPGLSLCAPPIFGALPAVGAAAPGMGAAAPGMGVAAPGMGNPLAELRPENVARDPGCPSQDVFGTEFVGCCDAAGVCGLSTEPFASGGAFVLPGFELPVACITAGDVPVELAAFLPQSPGAPLRCGGAGSDDDSSGGGDDGSGSGGGDDGSGSGGENVDPAVSFCLERELICAVLEQLLELIAAAFDVPDDVSSDVDSVEGGTLDAGVEVGADAGGFEGE